MKYFIIDTMGDEDTWEDYVFLLCRPKGIYGSDLLNSRSLYEKYPEIPETTMTMVEQDPGIKLFPLIGNLKNYLLVHKNVTETFKDFKTNTVEFWPFTLINKEGDVHSKDYYFVNDVNPEPTLDYELSDIKKDSTGTTVIVRKIVLDSKKIPNDIDFFRIKDTSYFAISERFKSELETKFENFLFDELEIV